MAGSSSELGNGRSSKAARFADPLAEDDAEGGLLQTKRESTYDMAEASMHKTMRLDEAPEATLKRAPVSFQLMVKGCKDVMWTHLIYSAGLHIWQESFFSVILCLPNALCWSYLLYYDHIHRWDARKGDWNTWNFWTFSAAFLLTLKMERSYNRWWEGRNHMGNSVKCCRSLLIALRPRLLPGQKAAWRCADDVRRYCMLYYWLLSFQLLEMDAQDQDVVKYHLKNRPQVRGTRGSNRQAIVVAYKLSDRHVANGSQRPSVAGGEAALRAREQPSPHGPHLSVVALRGPLRGQRPESV